jgi:hypothetical protein
MRVAGSSRLAARLFFQIVAACSVGLALFLVDRRGRDPLALAAIGLNPVIVLGVVNNAHNDALVGLAVLGAVLLVLSGRPVAAGLAGAAGALVKLSALLPVAAVGWWLWRRRGWRPAAAFGVATIFTVALVFSLSGGTAALRPLKDAGRQFTGGSIWNGPQRWVTRAKTEDGMATDTARARARAQVAGWAAVAVLALAAFLVSKRLRSPTPAGAVGASVLGFMLAAGYVYPWYVAWSLPALATEFRSRLSWLVMAHAAVLQFVILRDPTMLPGHLSPIDILPASQRLLDDVYRVGFPLLQLAMIVGVVSVSLRRSRPAEA